MVELDVRVRARRVEADGICSFELERAGGASLPAFRAGAHIDVHVPSGQVRQYSLCSDPGDASFWRIGVLREPASRGGSSGMHELVQVGSRLQVSAPKNLFALCDAPHSVLVAGGIGVTPILAMARQLHRDGKPFELHYCARSPVRVVICNCASTCPDGSTRTSAGLEHVPRTIATFTDTAESDMRTSPERGAARR